ncbi:MAG: LPXTG cell wall anchor domain-containing protein [Tissierellia bacterium]|nr:LPXTG cell wall anchor domain-containing protein [Tissierellia bacterium]
MKKKIILILSIIFIFNTTVFAKSEYESFWNSFLRAYDITEETNEDDLEIFLYEDTKDYENLEHFKNIDFKDLDYLKEILNEPEEKNDLEDDQNSQIEVDFDSNVKKKNKPQVREITDDFDQNQNQTYYPNEDIIYYVKNYNKNRDKIEIYLQDQLQIDQKKTIKIRRALSEKIPSIQKVQSDKEGYIKYLIDNIEDMNYIVVNDLRENEEEFDQGDLVAIKDINNEIVARYEYYSDNSFEKLEALKNLEKNKAQNKKSNEEKIAKLDSNSSSSKDKKAKEKEKEDMIVKIFDVDKNPISDALIKYEDNEKTNQINSDKEGIANLSNHFDSDKEYKIIVQKDGFEKYESQFKYQKELEIILDKKDLSNLDINFYKAEKKNKKDVELLQKIKPEKINIKIQKADKKALEDFENDKYKVDSKNLLLDKMADKYKTQQLNDGDYIIKIDDKNSNYKLIDDSLYHLNIDQNSKLSSSRGEYLENPTLLNLRVEEISDEVDPLPETGSFGTVIFTITGIFLMSISYYILKKGRDSIKC